jgi:hypothetical protein
LRVRSNHIIFHCKNNLHRLFHSQTKSITPKKAALLPT